MTTRNTIMHQKNNSSSNPIHLHLKICKSPASFQFCIRHKWWGQPSCLNNSSRSWKYITKPKGEGELPTRVLISGEIKNMCNAISREQLREIVSQEFRQLEDYTDLVYKLPGKTVVRKGDGTWESILVEESFAQGCPLSSVFAGMVLHHITRKIHAHLLKEVITRVRNKLKIDGERGGVPIVMGYVDNVNTLVRIEDVTE